MIYQHDYLKILMTKKFETAGVSWVALDSATARGYSRL